MRSFKISATNAIAVPSLPLPGTLTLWPVDQTVDCIFEKLMAAVLRATALPRIPFIWFWPEGHPSAAIMTHDVETSSGRDFCPRLMDIDDSYGIKSSFQLIPAERYDVPG